VTHELAEGSPADKESLLPPDPNGVAQPYTQTPLNPQRPKGICNLDIFTISEGKKSLLIMPSVAKPTLAARVEDKFICIIPCKKEENEVKSRTK
jgi:hypothetical protein